MDDYFIDNYIISLILFIFYPKLSLLRDNGLTEKKKHKEAKEKTFESKYTQLQQLLLSIIFHIIKGTLSLSHTILYKIALSIGKGDTETISQKKSYK